MESYYDYTNRCIKYIVKKNKNDYIVNHIFLSVTENIIFNELYNNEIVKVEQFKDIMEEGATRTAICRLRNKIKKVYKIKNVRKVGYMLERR